MFNVAWVGGHQRTGGWGWREPSSLPCVWLPAQHSGSHRHCQRDGEQNGDFTWKSFHVVLLAWEHKAENTEKVQILWGRICKCSLLNPWWRAAKGGQCVFVCVMWKTNEHCNVGYQPSPALLFLRANPAASPPLPPPPQPPQKLYNGELLSLCYLTPTTHYALPAWWETEEQRREEEEWEHRRPREEKVGWYQLKLALSEEKEKKRESVCHFPYCSIIIVILQSDLSSSWATLMHVLHFRHHKLTLTWERSPDLYSNFPPDCAVGKKVCKDCTYFMLTSLGGPML